MTSCNLVAHAGISRTRDTTSPTAAVAGPGADHPPPAARPQASATEQSSAAARPVAAVKPWTIVTLGYAERRAA